MYRLSIFEQFHKVGSFKDIFKQEFIYLLTLHPLVILSVQSALLFRHNFAAVNTTLGICKGRPHLYLSI